MKDKTHIMVDIETLGTKDDATIFQIAAASFDIETGEVFDEIDLKLDIKQTNEELNVDASTLLWWLNTDKELLTKLLNEGNFSECSMLNRFQDWVLVQNEEESKITLWGNGIIFDNVKLKQKMEKNDLFYPIKYKNDRDVRTILALAEAISGVTEREIKDSVQLEGESKHNAIDDVKFQIRMVTYCYQLLTKGIAVHA